MTLSDVLELMDWYDPNKTYEVTKHSARSLKAAQGYTLAGEIPDSTSSQDGTMLVWEVPDNPEPVTTKSFLRNLWPKE